MLTGRGSNYVVVSEFKGQNYRKGGGGGRNEARNHWHLNIIINTEIHLTTTILCMYMYMQYVCSCCKYCDSD